MKLHLDNTNMSARTGPNVFAKRLARALIERGHELVDSGPQADVSLVFIEPSGQPLSKRVVQRIDGIWFKPEEFHTKNAGIHRLYDNADAVIWQSEFDRSMTTRWWGQPKVGRVIHNGTDHVASPTVLIKPLAELRDSYEKVFVCSSNWHPQKRLRDNIALFGHLRSHFYPSSCLIVMGNNPDTYVSDKDVFYVGSLQPEVCNDVFSIADWMIHLAWLDHCPNVVVEALSCNVPIICSEAGGTKELVGGFGTILSEEREYGFELLNYDDPPKLNFEQINKPLPDRQSLGQCRDIRLSTVVDQYEEVLT